jgi:hypothetical protein
MAPRAKRNYLLWAILSAPFVGLLYAAIAYAVVRIGCRPSLSDVDFFSVPVTFFLLFALTLAALLLIVFAGLHALRALWSRAQRRERDRFQRRLGSLLILLLAFAVFAATVWAGDAFLHASCV